jgi:hypothetical protein
VIQAWDKVEMTYLANAGTIIENGITYSLPAGGDANLSATDFFGLEIQVQTFKRAQQNELGWNPAISTWTNSPHWRISTALLPRPRTP